MSASMIEQTVSYQVDGVTRHGTVTDVGWDETDGSTVLEIRSGSDPLDYVPLTACRVVKTASGERSAGIPSYPDRASLDELRRVMESTRDVRLRLEIEGVLKRADVL